MPNAKMMQKVTWLSKHLCTDQGLRAWPCMVVKLMPCTFMHAPCLTQNPAKGINCYSSCPLQASYKACPYMKSYHLNGKWWVHMAMRKDKPGLAQLRGSSSLRWGGSKANCCRDLRLYLGSCMTHACHMGNVTI